MNKIWLTVACSAAAFAIGYGLASNTIPARTVEVEKKVDKIVTRTVDRVTTVDEKPDGSKVTKIEERSRLDSEKKVDQRVREQVKPRPDWSIGLYSSLAPRHDVPAFTLTIDRRVIGNASVGVYVRYRAPAEYEAGLGLRIEF
jgi:hypothetical protein